MYSGPKIQTDGLVFALDATSRRSTLRATQGNNILPDPGTWTTGTGGLTGYSPNGSSSEQNRVIVTNDPWGRTSVTWRTTPDATSGADGGWNSAYYSIDRNYTYRWSIWVRRYTTGTGGTFYLGLNPAPLRNDNGASQGNPYFTCPGISSLTYNQWYLVVGHVFYEGYSGGRHSDSGWYENGVKISDKSFCNMGSQDGRWASTTTTSMLRAYHYYTTNTASGIEFAYPRLDKCDGNEPSISEMINVGESGWKDLIGKTTINTFTSPAAYTKDNQQGSFVFDGTDDYVDVNKNFGTLSAYSFDYVVYTTVNSKMPISTRTDTSFYKYGAHSWKYVHGGVSGEFYHNPGTVNGWSHWTVTYDGSNVKVYQNAVSLGSKASTGTANFSQGLKIGWWAAGGNYAFNGKIPVMKMYNRALSETEIKQNFAAYKNRFNI